MIPAEILAPLSLALVAAVPLLVWPQPRLLAAIEVLILAALLRLWFLSADVSLAESLYQLSPGVAVALRVDHLALLWAIAGAAVIAAITGVGAVPRVSGRALAWIALAQAGGLLGLMAAGLYLLVLGWAAAAVLLLLVCIDAPRGPASPGAAIKAGVLLLGAAVLALSGVAAVESAAGSATFEAIPATAIGAVPAALFLGLPLAVLLALPSLLRVGRQMVVTWTATAAVVVPLAAYTLMRVFDAGEGQLPAAGLGYGLILVGGVLALAYATSALWAADLGSTVVRLATALLGLMLAAAGAGGQLGLIALATFALSLTLILPAMAAVLTSSGGRLPAPGSGAVGGWLVLFALAGMPVGLGLESRVLLIRSLASIGGLPLLAGAPAVIAVVVVAAAAALAARFSSEAASPAGARLRVGLIGWGLAAVGLIAALSALEPIAGIATTTGRVVAGLIAGGLTDALPGKGAAALFVLVAAGAAVYLSTGKAPVVRRLHRFRGLPPPGAVIAPLAVRRWLDATASLLRAVARSFARRPVASVVGSWAFALLALLVVAPR